MNYSKIQITLLAKKYGYPKWMIERYTEILGPELEEFLEACEKPLPKSIRVNTLKINSETLIRDLEAKGFNLEPVKWCRDGYWVKNPPMSIGATFEHLLGYYFIQTSASMLPPLLLNPSPENIILDMCAAPGGKTSHIAQILKNKGSVISIEIDAKRALSLKNNLSRCGVINTLILNMDAKDFPKLNYKVDKIILDAPCSGEGLIRQKPERKTSRTINDIIYCSNNQKQLVEAAYHSLNEGGTLIYSTCSIAPEENEEVIDYLIRNFPMRIETINIEADPGLTSFKDKTYDKSLIKAKRIYPHKHESIGFFICKLLKEKS
ncbi:MAG: RsmB/NOP family class I SAM-dependent RNA methyltransferase [Candidatus Odinarchaeota archaeon]